MGRIIVESLVSWSGALRRAAVLASLLAAPGAALAAHPLVTDDAGTLGKGSRQVELTAEVARDRDTAGGVVVRETGGEVVATLALGLHDRVDLVVGAPSGWSRVRENGVTVFDASGIGDVGAELKLRVLEVGGFAVAVKPGLSLPTGDETRGLGTGAVSYGATLILSQELGPVALHVNGAYARDEYGLEEDRRANRRDRWHGSLAATAEVMDGLQAVANVGVETNGDRASSTHPAFALAGVVYSVTESLDVDVGLKAGLSRTEADLTALAGIASRF
jgi:hypothetical protein